MMSDLEKVEFEKTLSSLKKKSGILKIGFEQSVADIGLDNAIKAYIIEFVLKNQAILKTKYRVPVSGFASAEDALWTELREIVRPDHYLPKQLFPDAGTIISIFLPFSEKVISGNIGGVLPSQEWGTAYNETNEMLDNIRKGLAGELQKIDYACMTEIPPTQFERQVRYGNDLPNKWSQRSVAYIAGIGTFGLHHSIITEKGCAGRLTSLITTAHVTATKKPEREFCPALIEEGSCDKCIANCPADVIGTRGIDRDKCMEYLYLDVYKKDRGPGCGKCLVDVPCAMEIPQISHMNN